MAGPISRSASNDSLQPQSVEHEESERHKKQAVNQAAIRWRLAIRLLIGHQCRASPVITA
jgi:hypothetical protein